MNLDQQRLELEVQALGTEILTELNSASGKLLDPQFYTEKFLNWGMSDEELKISLFRFVDVLPNLPNSRSIIEHVQQYFTPLKDKLPDLLAKGLNISPHSLTSKLVSKGIRHQVKMIAERFIVGESAKDAISSLRKIRRRGCAFTVDLVGEAALGENESQEYVQRYLELLTTLSQVAPKWKESAAIISGHRGEHSPINISVKLSALYSQAKPVSTNRSISALVERLSEILTSAVAVGAFVYVDMEDSSLTDITLEVFKKTLEQNGFDSYPHFGIVLQSYLRRTEKDLDELIAWTEERAVPIGVRLVKGAYWDTETILAQQRGWVVPVWQEKSCSDAAYEKLCLKLLQNQQLIAPAFASHNVRSLCHAIVAAKMLGISPTQFEIQILYGMADPIKLAFAKRGYLIREYSPVGELLPGMGYLVRRLLENTSNEGFLRQGIFERQSPELLLQKPRFSERFNGEEYIPKKLHQPFANCPLLDFSEISIREQIGSALSDLYNRSVKSAERVRPIISGSEIACEHSIKSVSPENIELTLAQVELASAELAQKAIDQVAVYFPTWRETPVAERAEILFRTARILTKRRHRLIALMILEAGKPWLEADADFAEAIDFLNYYGEQALQLGQTKQLGRLAGEQNIYFYEPRGITAVISPWNFPLAIPCGMFAAALVTGNCAILKPAEQTSLIARELFQAFLDGGLPPEAAAFLPGLGEEVGALLASSPMISTVVFTGSKEVGLQILDQSTQPEHRGEHIRRVIAEMGGKNAIIVDEDADLDEAVKGVVYSAFGFQGQKCSACSRVLVVEAVYQRFLDRLCDATLSISIGAASDAATYVGPVIDQSSYQRLNSALELASQECTIAAQGILPTDLAKGYYIPPTVVTNIPDGHRLLSDELFGPVLAVRKVASFEAGLSEALASEYGLTGGVFSRSPKNIALAIEEFRVGNLYINRSCTGALVYRQPFGGAKMSGVGSKAGGPDYLQQFLIPRAVSENTIRRGFAPL